MEQLKNTVVSLQCKTIEIFLQTFGQTFVSLKTENKYKILKIKKSRIWW